MACWTLSELARTEGVGRIVVVTSEPELQHLALRLRIDWVREPAAAGGLGAAIAAGLDYLGELDSHDVGILHADLPLVTAEEVARIVALHVRGPARQLTLVTDRRGDGTNLMLCRPGHAVPNLYGPGSAARHVNAARRAGLRVETLPSARLSLDLDLPEDVQAVRASLHRRSGRNPALALLDSWSSGEAELELSDADER